MRDEQTKEVLNSMLAINKLTLELQEGIQALSTADKQIIQLISKLTERIAVLEDKNSKLAERIFELEKINHEI